MAFSKLNPLKTNWFKFVRGRPLRTLFPLQPCWLYPNGFELLTRRQTGTNWHSPEEPTGVPAPRREARNAILGRLRTREEVDALSSKIEGDIEACTGQVGIEADSAKLQVRVISLQHNRLRENSPLRYLVALSPRSRGAPGRA